MFAIPGLVLLVVVDCLKPQEYVPLLSGIPILYVLTALTVVGFLVDLRLGLSRLGGTPQLGFVIALVAWSMVTDLQNGVGVTLHRTFSLLISVSLYVLVAHVVQTIRALQVVMGVVLVTGLTLAFVGTHQGLAPFGCFRYDYGQHSIGAAHDGRSCSPDEDDACVTEDSEPGVRFACEHVGLFGTQSVGGRVRFRGTMEDPNELSLAVAAVVPLAFAFHDRRRTRLRLLLLLATVALAGTCIVFTQSRGGQLAFAIVLGVYLFKRFGKVGLVAAALAAAPILLLGGRDTQEAAESTLLRLEAWSIGLAIFRNFPFAGVGLGQFAEYHELTAHNSLVLTAAELGIPGLMIWTSIVYISVKIPLQALRATSDASRPVALAMRPWSFAMLAAMAALIAGTMTLSYAYKEMLWIFIGLTGALYRTIRRHDPSFQVSYGPADLAIVMSLAGVSVVAIALYTSVQLGA